VTTIHLDFETRSTVDLPKTGVHVYADHPDTDVWCAAYAVDDGPVELWTPGGDDLVDLHMRELARRDDTIWMAHNAAFELAIWNRLLVPRYGFAPLPAARTRCTMAMAYALALPGSLENAAAAVGLDIGKDMEGRALMLRMSRPRGFKPSGEPIWWNEPEKLQRLYDYCIQDVEVERKLEKRLLPLTEAEQRLWELDQRINDRGVQIDMNAVENAMAVVDEAKARLDKEMARVTGGWVSGVSKVMDLTEWLGMRGVTVESVAKADVLTLLDRDDLPADARRALELRQEGAKASTAKLKAMRLAVNVDARARGLHQFHGAATGRWAGRRIQTQNLTRPNMDQDSIDEVLALLSGQAA
jgi:DNA polymerase